MALLKHLPSPIAPSFSEALRIDTQAGCWIFVSGQVGVLAAPWIRVYPARLDLPVEAGSDWGSHRRPSLR